MTARSSHTMNAQKVYPKDSLDRFGDDLCQHLLSFLSLEDRFRCECVSKQWQRVVYETQTELTIDPQLYRHFSHELLYIDSTFERFIQLLLKKCLNLSYIEVKDFKDSYVQSIRDIIGECFHNPLNAINMRLNGNQLDESGDDYHHKLCLKLCTHMQTALKDYKPVLSAWMSAKMAEHKPDVKLCVKLCKTNVYSHDDYITVRQLFSDRNEIMFERLNRFYFVYTSGDCHQFQVFVQNFAKYLKSISVTIDSYDCDEKSIDLLVTGLTQMRALVELNVDFNCNYRTLSAAQLTQIGVNLRRLKAFGIRFAVDYTRLESADNDIKQLKQIIGKHLTQIRRLRLRGQYFGSLDSVGLIECKRLGPETGYFHRKRVFCKYCPKYNTRLMCPPYEPHVCDQGDSDWCV